MHPSKALKLSGPQKTSNEWSDNCYPSLSPRALVILRLRTARALHRFPTRSVWSTSEEESSDTTQTIGHHADDEHALQGVGERIRHLQSTQDYCAKLLADSDATIQDGHLHCNT